VSRLLRAIDSPELIAACALTLAIVVAVAVQGCGGTACSGSTCSILAECEQDRYACDAAHVCREQVCEGKVYICGLDAHGNHVWQVAAASCDDHDPCTQNDVCTMEVCVGTPVDCSVPPLPACKGTGTLQTWETGVCSAGECSYTLTELACPKNDCVEGSCQSDPCFGKTCDTPPSNCYSSPGTCVDGVCQYATKEKGAACVLADKCMQNPTCDGAGKCTGTPLSCADAAKHIASGTCVNGVCQDLKCVSPWATCDAKSPCAVPAKVPNSCTTTAISYGSDKPGSACGTPYCGTGKYPLPGGAHCAFCSHAIIVGSGCYWCLWPKQGGTGKFDSSSCPATGSSACCNTDWTKVTCASGDT
jgi:hypothetical protein